MASSPCHLCATCLAEERLGKGEEVSLLDGSRCRHQDVMRPSLEVCGIDAFGPLENSGWDTMVLKDHSPAAEIFDQELLE